MISFKSYLILEDRFDDYLKKKESDTWYEPITANDAVDKFKALTKKNQIAGEKKDIGYWMDRPIIDFINFVDTMAKAYENSRKLKTKAKSEDSPILFENDKVVIYEILSKAASCKLGSDTPWCITKQNQDYYEWHKNHGYDIIFIIPKANPDNKMCFIMNEWKYSVWNSENSTIDYERNFIQRLKAYDVPDYEIEDLFEVGNRISESPNYDVPNGEDDDGEWEEEQFNDGDWEPEEEEVNEWFNWEGLHFNVDDIKNQNGFEVLVNRDPNETINKFIDSYIEQMLENDGELYQRMVNYLGWEDEEDATPSNVAEEFKYSDGYAAYREAMIEELKEFVADEMEGEVEVHPHANERPFIPFVRARLSMFKTYPHIVFPMLEED